MSHVPDDLERRRIAVFVAVAFGLSWTVGVVVFLTGGLRNSPVLVDGTPITLALVLVAGGYMWAPAVANVVTRLLTDEGFGDAWLGLRLRAGWPYWLAAWLLPAVLTVLGAAAFFLAFPDSFDPTLAAASESLALAGVDAEAFPGGVWGFAAIQLLQAMLVAPVVNAAFTFGEEFGWRGYLLQKLLPIGRRRAVVVLGVVWGVWHWPVIAMGHNYGFGYPGAPWTGMLAMTWFTVVAGTFLAWVTLRSGSVWPAVVGHAAINSVAALGLLFVRGSPNPLLGPAPTGVVAALPWAALAAWLLWRQGSLAPPGE